MHLFPLGDALAPSSSSSLVPSFSGASSFSLSSLRPLPFTRMDAGEINLLKEQRVAYVNSLLCEGHLDEQFKQVQMLQDANNPRFVADLIALYCQDSEKILDELSQSLNEETPDFKKVDASVHQFKGSSASVGANQVKLACIELRIYSEQANKDGCKDALNMIKQKFYILKNKLETLIQMERKIQALEGAQV